MFILSYALLLLLLINPYLFAVQDGRVLGLLVFSVATLSLLFPLLATGMMKALGLIETLEMKDNKERIGPMIVTIVFYMWLFINIKSNYFIPDAYRFFVLGSTISLCFAFILNTQTRISLHTVGVGGLLAGFLLIRFNFSYDTFVLNLLGTSYEVQTNVLLILIILISGAVGSARLFLKAHSPDQVYGGYFVGVISMLIAYRFIIM